MTKRKNLEVALWVRAGAQGGNVDREAHQHIDRREEHEAGQ